MVKYYNLARYMDVCNFREYHVSNETFSVYIVYIYRG